VACVYLSEATSPPRFLFGVENNYVGSESGQTKDTGTEDTVSRFGRRNQMSSSNILSIHGLKKKCLF
jgi:hypothetical protein